MPCDQVYTVTGTLQLADLGMLLDTLQKPLGIGDPYIIQMSGKANSMNEIWQIYVPETDTYVDLTPFTRTLRVSSSRNFATAEADLTTITETLQRAYTKRVIKEASRFGWNVEMDGEEVVLTSKNTQGGW